MSAESSVTLEIEAFDLLEKAVEKGEDIWQATIDLGIAARQDMDRGRFAIGDSALLVSKKYGENRIGAFAAEIGVNEERVEEYRGVCKFFPRKHPKRSRQDLLDLPMISYSHLRLAKTLKDFDLAVDFIDECAVRRLKYEAAAVLLKERKAGNPNPKLFARCAEFYGVPVGITAHGQLVIDLGSIAPSVAEKLRLGKQMKWVAFGLDEEEDHSVEAVTSGGEN